MRLLVCLQSDWLSASALVVGEAPWDVGAVSKSAHVRDTPLASCPAAGQCLPAERMTR